MLRLAFIKFLYDDYVKAVLDVCEDECNLNNLSAREVADYIVTVFKQMGDYPQECFELKDTSWWKDYLIRVLPEELVPDYTPFTAYEMVAIVGKGTNREGNAAGLKTKRIVLSKKESEIDIRKMNQALS